MKLQAVLKKAFFILNIFKFLSVNCIFASQKRMWLRYPLKELWYEFTQWFDNGENS
jgi:hypothetical protein